MATITVVLKDMIYNEGVTAIIDRYDILSSYSSGNAYTAVTLLGENELDGLRCELADCDEVSMFYIFD